MFYTFRQNNSGGKWKGPRYVIVEAVDHNHANSIAENHGVYFHGIGDCKCCGTRWDRAEEWDGFDAPTAYGDLPIQDETCWYVIYYLDGRVEEGNKDEVDSR